MDAGQAGTPHTPTPKIKRTPPQIATAKRNAATRFWWGWGCRAKDTPNSPQEATKKPPKANTKGGNCYGFNLRLHPLGDYIPKSRGIEHGNRVPRSCMVEWLTRHRPLAKIPSVVILVYSLSVLYSGYDCIDDHPDVVDIIVEIFKTT